MFSPFPLSPSCEIHLGRLNLEISEDRVSLRCTILRGFVRNFYTHLALDIIGYVVLLGRHGK